mgnify:CR=1 FL=1
MKKLYFLSLACLILLISGCARMGTPDGGWYDETPPRVIGTSPADKSTNVSGHKFYIHFNEYILIDNPTENVVVSPPQINTPDIRSQGKRILVNLKDTLLPNTTYTIDFSDAITDNNESNPLGNYTYTFSTGNQIDTLEVSGYVLDAETLEPTKGILAGLYNSTEDSLFTTQSLQRIAKTDQTGHFTIRGIAPGKYRVYALNDMDGDYKYSQASEQIAFIRRTIVPFTTDAVRQDTIWKDTLHIDHIKQEAYTRFLPDDILLRSFTRVQTDRYLVKSDRKNENRIVLYFSYGSEEIPVIRGLNFDSEDAFLVEASEKKDTLTYWIRNQQLVDTDSLQFELTYSATDSTGVLEQRTDTLLLLPKYSYEKRKKEQDKKMEEWEKKQAKKKKRGEAYDSIYPVTPLNIQMLSNSKMAPDENVRLAFSTPIKELNGNGIHLYSQIDSAWYESKYRLEPDPLLPRTYTLRAEWRPDVTYSLEIDSATFVDIYGKANEKYKQGLKINSNDEYSSLVVTIPIDEDANYICQLLDNKPTVKKEVKVVNGQAEFFYIKPGTYFLKLINDENYNGKWDTGDYEKNLQPEEVFFYSKPVECKAKWDVTLNWVPNLLPLNAQKPNELKKTETTKKKDEKNRNAERARKLGITYTPPKNF